MNEEQERSLSEGTNEIADSGHLYPRHPGATSEVSVPSESDPNLDFLWDPEGRESWDPEHPR